MPVLGRVVLPFSAGAMGVLLASGMTDTPAGDDDVDLAAAGAPERAGATLTRTGTGGQFVSLSSDRRQVVRPNTWTLLRFEREHADAVGWHRPNSALITPRKDALAMVCYKVTWTADARPTQYFAQIARDPLGRTDVTGGENAANVPGRDYRALCWTMKVRRGQPLAIRVKHDGARASSVPHAQFKVWIP